VLNGLVDESEGHGKIAQEHVMLCLEVVEPEEHSGVLFFFIAKSQSPLFLHRASRIGQEAVDGLDFGRGGVELAKVLHE